MGSPITAMLANAGAGGPTGTSMEELCAQAGTDQRKREALGCPPMEGTVNLPTVPTPGDPDMGQASAPVQAPPMVPEAPTYTDIALMKQGLGQQPAPGPEAAALGAYQAVSPAVAAGQATSKPGVLDMLKAFYGGMIPGR